MSYQLDMLAKRYFKHSLKCKLCKPDEPCANGRLILAAMASVAILSSEQSFAPDSLKSANSCPPEIVKVENTLPT